MLRTDQAIKCSIICYLRQTLIINQSKTDSGQKNFVAFLNEVACTMTVYRFQTEFVL